jgi:hypothetical protein
MRAHMKQDWIDKLESLQKRVEELQASGHDSETLAVMNDLIGVFIEEIKVMFCMK